MNSRHDEYLAALPRQWDQLPIDAIGVVHSGSTPSRSVPSYWDGDIPWVTPGELTGLKGKYIESTQDKITQAGLSNCAATLLPRDTLLVTTRATVGSVALAAVPTATNQGFRAVVLKDGADPHFFYHLFSRMIAEFVRRASGTTFLEISGREFRAVVVPLPPLPEQRLIALILDTFDAAIRKTEQVIAKLQQMKQGLLHDLLTRGIDENGELRDPDRHPEQFKRTELGVLPGDWRIGGFLMFPRTDREPFKTGPFGTEMTGRTWAAEGTPVVTIGSLGTGEFIRAQLLHLDAKDARYLRAYELRNGDLVFSRVADVGRSAVIGLSEDGWIMSSNLMRISMDPNEVVPSYAHSVITDSHSSRSQIRRLVNAGAREVVNTAILRSMRFPWPGIREQERICDVVGTIEGRFLAERLLLAKLSELKRGLADDLLSGRVRVTVSEEPF